MAARLYVLEKMKQSKHRDRYGLFFYVQIHIFFILYIELQ